MRNKVKITKRQIKEDKFTNNMLLAKDWLMENWQIVSIAAAIVVVAIVAVVYFTNVSKGKEQEAMDRYYRAVAEFRRQNYQPAILEFGSIANEYSGEIAGMALFNLANAHYESKNYDEAMTNFQKYIDNYHDDKLITASAIAGIAACLEDKSDFKAAGDKFMEAIEYYPDSPNAPDFYLGAVRNYVMAGDEEDADKTLSELKEKYPNTPYSKSATRLAMRLKV